MDTKPPAVEQGGLPYGFSPLPGPSRKVASRRLIHYAAVALGFTALVCHMNYDVWKYLSHKDDWRELASRIATKPVGTMEWGACAQPSLPGVQCGYLVAPLDYLEPTAGHAYIAVSRYPASVQPKKGSALFNPGGPGGSGKTFIQSAGDVLQNIIGKDYDIIGFDPRGIGETLPSTSCFQKTDYATFKRNTVLERSFDITSNVSLDQSRLVLLQGERRSQALLETQFDICNKTMGEQLRYMGTTTVVHDIDFIVKALDGDDALINFYGASYGTILGQYLVNMLPHRVGRIVIDGVADAVAWSSEPYYTWYHSWLSSTEKTYDIFVTRCGEVGPDICALANKVGEKGQDIKARLEQFIDDLYYKPLPVPNANIPGTLTAGIARMYLLESLERPGAWDRYAKGLTDAMNGNGTTIINDGPYAASRDLERSAVSCNDQRPFPAPSPETVVDALLEVYQNVSRFAFAVYTSEPDAGCQYWPIPPPPERFEGPWNQSLRNPMLVVSNTADPVTPISSGQLVQKLLGDSARLLVQDSPGHCSLALPSQCTVDSVRAYFANGTLPEPGTVCQLDSPPFHRHNTAGRSEEEVLASLGRVRLAAVLHEARKGRLHSNLATGALKL